jgi:hypothetical protein
MLAKDIADRIAIAYEGEITGILQHAWGAHADGLITVNELEAVEEAARSRREAIEAPPAPRLPVPPRPRRERSPQQQRSLERRRTNAYSGPMPVPMAARFTVGELAVLDIVGDEVRLRGFCDRSIGELGSRAGVHRTTVQNALRQAKAAGLISVEYREPERGRRRSLTNIIRIVSKEWLTWLSRRGRPMSQGSIKKTGTTDNESFLRGNADGTPPWGVPDGVYSREAGT